MTKTREQIEKEFENINRPLNLDIQKGRTAVVGEVRDWGGKKYKKQGNGKWVEVSEYGMSKKEHADNARKYSDKSFKDRGKEGNAVNNEKTKFHVDNSNKLSDKEFTDEELMGGEGSSSDKKINELKTLLGKEDATISIKKKDGDDIIYVNGQTAYNSSDKGMTSNEDKKKALTRAYEASKKGSGEQQNHEKGDVVKFYHAGLGKDKTGKIVDYREKNGKIVYDIKVDGTTTTVEDVPQSDIGFKKSLEDHFNNINSELSFEKSEGNDLEKGDMQYALGDIKFKKKGSELKKMIETKKSTLLVQKAEAKIALDLLVSEYQEKGGVVIYDENNIPQIKSSVLECVDCNSVSDYSNIQQKRIPTPDGFWDKSYQLRSICEDIKTLETLQSNLEDNKEYEMTTRQLTCLQ